MQGPWSIFLIHSESEKARRFLLLCIIIYMYVKLRWFLHNGLSIIPRVLQYDAFGKHYNATGLSTCQASKMSVIDINSNGKKTAKN